MSRNGQAKKNIGTIVRKARERKKLSACDLAKECNVTRGRIYQWEGSGYILPKNLPALAAALEISVKTLKAANGPSTYVPKKHHA